jgi:hypothetical protein
MNPLNWHSCSLHTAWKGQDIVIYRNEVQIDRLRSEDIERVVLVHRGDGHIPGDLQLVLFVMADEVVGLPAETGITGRILFERLSFWSQRDCIYWVSARKVQLPESLRRCRVGLLGQVREPVVRVPRAQVEAALEQWPTEGPQTWDARKQQRIELAKPFSRASLDTRPLDPATLGSGPLGRAQVAAH